MEDKIIITKQELITLKRLYSKAVKDNKKVFKFMGREVLTSYAKYLIEFLDNKLK